MIKFQNEKKNIKDIRSKYILSNIFTLFSFFMLLFISIKLVSPELIIQIRNVSATSQTSEQTVGSYTLSMSNDTNVTIDITPTSSQQVFTANNDITLTNTCPAGATISIETNSSSSNALERVGSDNKTKTISATTGTSLNDNSWGFSLDDGETYRPVPTKNSTSTYIYDENSSASNTTIPILFGVKTNNALPSGNYNTDIVYTANVKAGCLTYNVTWDLDGGTGASGKTYPTTMNFDQTINLSELTPTKSGYTFTGWSNGTDKFNGDETSADINEGGASSITMTAQWLADCNDGINAIGGTKTFDYTGNVQTFNACAGRQYKLEVWGAQGGTSTSNGGYGGYSFGNIKLSSNKTLYVVTGQGGVSSTSYVSSVYNGGGGNSSTKTQYSTTTGGGATHIATRTGVLSSLSSYLSDILIVAGGGGGSTTQGCSSGYQSVGGQGGGYTGGKGPNSNSNREGGYGGTQSSGGQGGLGTYNTGADVRGSSGVFGAGGATGTSSGNCITGGGGGGGLYGGGGGAAVGGGGGGGSGYIGNSLLLSGKGMYMYNSDCNSSSTESTKTTCVSNVSHATSQYANTGNGYAKITYLGTEN